ncbi:DUF2845 domain-containing protein [Aquisalimonas sp.]|uniref:DUF2845 domain-containing protein n=1 Tax=Aquisalimonas sp. TaxID=1872621 RepID=UPI0025BB51CC|nr:DUF2845 domain-containing protein [Aquisalimonas sp.]
MRWTIPAVVLLLASSTLDAAPMRCGNDLVRTGDHITGVHDKCGQPIRTTRLVNRFGAVVGWREIYDSARGSRNHQVTYEGERVVRIELLR